MRTLIRIALAGMLMSSLAGVTMGQEGESEANGASRMMRPAVRGRHFAVASMKAEATRAAERILEKGGNAFDAIVAGQAVLGIVDAAMNGVGSDAVLLVYDAKTKKVYSIDAEGTAPRLATIEWYKEHNGGKLPVNDSVLSGNVPGCIDAWYILLDRWGTMSFAQVLAEAIDLAENGFPVGDSFARALATSQKLRKYPTSTKVYLPNNRAPQAGEIFRNPDLARTLRRLVEAETQNRSKGRKEALKAARDRFYKGDIAREMAKFSEDNGGLFRYEDFAEYTAKIETPVSVDYRGYQVYKNPSASQGPAELIALNLLEGYDVKKMGLNSPDYIHTSIEAIKLAMADREKFMGDMDFVKIPYDGLLFMITGSPGGDDQVMRTIQTLMNVVDFGMNIQQAIEAPRWSTRSFPASPFPHTMYPGEMSLESRIPEATRQALVARGHTLKVSGPWSQGSNGGIVVGANGVVSAGADPRVDAYAWAW